MQSPSSQAAWNGSSNALEALHLLDIALAVQPEEEIVRNVRREALTLLLDQTGRGNLWERMWIASELRALDAEPSG